MILLRRGRSVQPVGSTFDVDVTFEIATNLPEQGGDPVAPWRPPIEAYETAEALMVRAEIGGISRDAVHVSLDGNELRLRGERLSARPLERRLYHESRVRYGPFDVRIRVPLPVDLATADAEYVDGFLTVRLPRLVGTSVVPRQPGEHPTAGVEKSSS